ncbi:MAG: hypothetical protein OXB97_08545 [Rhodospirillales bacterium]|nr:hypothetical protein [Rhodospirillales bacterium]
MTERHDRLDSIRKQLAKIAPKAPDAEAVIDRLTEAMIDRLTADELAMLRRVLTAAADRSEAPAPGDMTADLFARDGWLGAVSVMPFVPVSESDGRRESWALDLANGASLAGLVAAAGGAPVDLALRVRWRAGMAPPEDG